MVVQKSPSSVRASWRPPDPLRDATGYRIEYSSGVVCNGSVTIRGSSTDNYLLTGLQNGAIYTISIVATSDQLPSESMVAVNAHLGVFK